MWTLLNTLFLNAAAQAPDEYPLGVGDTLEVSVYGEPELSGSFPIGSTGDLEYPLLGAVTVEGMTTAEASALLQQRLSDGFLVVPSVTAWLASYQSQPVQVIGAVTTPGMYYLKGSTTILQVLSEAGGMKLDGIDEIRITHGDEAGEATVLSYEQMISSGEGNVTLRGGDIVFVPELLISVIGQVEQPGALAFRKGMTVSTGLAAAGGAMPTANMGRVYILRGEERIEVNVRKILKGRTEDILLEADDRILVQESFF